MKLKNLLYLLIISTLLSSCVNYEEVTLSDIKSIKLLELGNKGLTIETELKLNNPNAYSIKVTKSEFDVYIKNNKIGVASIASPLELSKSSDDYHLVKLITTFEENQANMLPGLLAMSALGSGKIDVKLDGYIEGKAMFIKKRIELVHEEKVPLDFLK